MADLEKYGIVAGRGKYYEEAIYSMALIYNICQNKMSTYLKKFNLSSGKLNILVAIRHQGGDKGISQVDISKHLIVTPSNMTKLLDKLEKEEFVTRSPMPGDRRVNIIKVTPKAADLLDSIWDEYCHQLESLMTNLNSKDQEIIASKLLKWLNVLLEEK